MKIISGDEIFESPYEWPKWISDYEGLQAKMESIFINFLRTNARHKTLPAGDLSREAKALQGMLSKQLDRFVEVESLAGDLMKDGMQNELIIMALNLKELADKRLVEISSTLKGKNLRKLNNTQFQEAEKFLKILEHCGLSTYQNDAKVDELYAMAYMNAGLEEPSFDVLEEAKKKAIRKPRK